MYCDTCNMPVAGRSTECPLCGGTVFVDKPKVKEIPKKEPKKKKK